MSSPHLLTLADKTSEEITALLDLGAALKDRMQVHGDRDYKPLAGRSLAMIFEKRSTRTRVSTETGMFKLGGHALFLSSADIQLGGAETVHDTAKVLSRFNDAILARVNHHADVAALAEHGSVPVTNALSEVYHPLQILADMMTLKERFGRLDGLRIAWVGDGNNVLHSFMAACPKLGIHLSVAVPEGFDADPDIQRRWAAEAAERGVGAVVTRNPEEAVAGANVVVTDTWVSMGQEEEKARRLSAFGGYQVTEKLCAGADPDWAFLHCLPRYPFEVDDAVFHSPERSLVWDEAENRMWSVMAVLHAQLAGLRFTDEQ